MKINIHNGQITRHFNIDEFIDDSGKLCDLFIDENFFPFVMMLQEFRDYYGRPININSGYRSKSTNVAVGGSTNSAHLKSNAIDFNLPHDFYFMTYERREDFYQNVKSYWCMLCDKYGFFPQVNFYNTYLHLGISTIRASFIDKRS